MKRLSLWLPLTGLLLCVCIVAQAPAQLLLLGAQRQIAGLTVSGVSGTVWRGEADGLCWQWGAHAMALSTLDWQTQWLSLLRLRPMIALQARRQQQDYRMRVSLPPTGGLHLDQVALEVPAEVVSASSTLPISGLVSAQLERFAIRDQQISEARGRVVWQDAAIVLDGRRLALGSFAAELSSRDALLVATVFDLGGPGQFEGEFTLQGDGNYVLRGFLAAREDADSLISDLLPLLGEQTDDGRIRLVHRGSLR